MTDKHHSIHDRDAAATADKWCKDLADCSRSEKIAILSSFFKTGPGEYGEGDIFIGVAVPDNRKVACRYRNASFETFEIMLASDVHEHRLSALLALVERYERDPSARDIVVKFYLAHTTRINNWDLVDLSVYKILGHYTLDSHRELLWNLAESNNLWENRMAIVATMAHVRRGDFDTIKPMAVKMLNHNHDLMHKAVGWLLREMGKRDEHALTEFLDRHARAMPRTMLRYAIERLEPQIRHHYLAMR